jgi:hypothetical protein
VSLVADEWKCHIELLPLHLINVGASPIEQRRGYPSVLKAFE